MTHSISQTLPANRSAANFSSANPVLDAGGFVRKGSISSAETLAAKPVRNDAVIYTQVQRRENPVSTSRIPRNFGVEPQAATALRANSRNLIASMANSQNPAARQNGIPFFTHRGEPGVVRHDGRGGVDIVVSGKQVFACFNDMHYSGDVHVMMAGPDGRMCAGRLLPPEYIAEGNSLVAIAQAAAQGGNVARLANHWGNR